MSKITAQQRTCNRYGIYRRDGLALCDTRRSARQQDFAGCHFYETELTRKTNLSKNYYISPKYEILAKMAKILQKSLNTTQTIPVTVTILTTMHNTWSKYN